VVTPARPPKLEPEGLNESPHVRERDVRKIPARDSGEQSPWAHGETLPLGTASWRHG
jgi:hypothetical protein